MYLSKDIKISDVQLCRLIKEGDKQAFTDVYYKYHQLLYTLSFRFLMDQEQSKDVVQYVFVRLWESRMELNIHTSLKNFLFTMAKNYILNLIRNENSALINNYEIVQQRSDIEDDLIKNLEKKELRELLYEAISKLPKQKKQVCFFKLEGELTNQEIAERLHLSVNTVKTHYSESLKILRIELKRMLIIIIMVILMH